MKIRDMIAMAVGSLFKRKVRTVLTIAGVVIGTCAIVVMLSLGFGMKQSMETSMKSMGDLTVITIYNGRGGSVEEGGGAGADSAGQPAVLDDKAIQTIKSLPDVTAVTPVFSLSPSCAVVNCRRYRFQGMIFGVAMDTLESFGYKMKSGALPKAGAEKTTVLFGNNAEYDFIDTGKKNGGMIFPQPDKNGNMPKAFVDLTKDSFEITVGAQEEPVGGMMRGKSQKAGPARTKSATRKRKPEKLTVSGVLAEDFGKDPNPSDCIFMDLAYAKELKAKYNTLNGVKSRTEQKGYESAAVKASSVETVSGVQKAIQDMGFQAHSMQNERDVWEKQLRTVQMILGGLGAISLLVAALGITNTMIMSIYERTREIGIMKVLGCVVRNIRAMFLIEAGSIGFLGGVAGVGISYGISAILNFFSSRGSASGQGGGSILNAGGGSISIIPVWLAAGAVVFATMVGLLSGLYPANRAMRVSALTAIRQE